MASIFDEKENSIYIGQEDKIPEWLEGAPDHEKRVIEKVKLLLKNYLELDNVSFLFGSGSSIHLGAVAIRNFPIEIEAFIKEKEPLFKGIYDELLKTIKILQSSEFTKIISLQKGKKIDPLPKELEDFNKWFVIKDELIRVTSTNDLAVEFERVLNFLIAKNYTLNEDKTQTRTDKIDQLITACKEGLFNVVDVEKRQIPESLLRRKKESAYPHHQEQAKLLETESKYIFHQKFLKALLQRPLNLRRANIFTANYDLAFEYSFDKLGVHYIDGFSGFHKRYFKPETFEYDIFYPGSTTAGKVQRIEKVVRYFKLHGSISWVNSDKRDANNLYGIEELPLSLVENLKKKGEILIYPTAVKKTYTLDLPYSELFRQFAATISQPQSVLITVGYAFADEHFNDICGRQLEVHNFWQSEVHNFRQQAVQHFWQQEMQNWDQN